jgi:hypothetical protein
MQDADQKVETARHALELMEEALRLLDLAGEELAACHLAGAIDRLEHVADRRE